MNKIMLLSLVNVVNNSKTFVTARLSSSICNVLLSRHVCTCKSLSMRAREPRTLRNDEEEEFNNQQKYVLKVAVLGVPNCGKSTLINQILDRRVCSASSKVHTTIRKTRAMFIDGNTQIVFLDTPGLVSENESKRHHLVPSFINDAVSSLKEADLLAVVHDVGNKWTHDALDFKVLKLLESVPQKNSVLILNKVDILHAKRPLLDLAQKLSKGSLRPTEPCMSRVAQNFKEVIVPTIERKAQKMPEKEVGWPYFSEIFMVSALTGSGVGDIKEYMLMQAKPGEWAFPADTFTDQKPQEIAELAVREKLLDNLPQEIPYKIKTSLEIWDTTTSGLLSIVVTAKCPTRRYSNLLLKNKGALVRKIATEAEQSLSSCLRCGVRLRINVIDTEKQAN